MKYEKIRYPDGQISAKIINQGLDFHVKERINNYEDLFFIKSVKDACDSEHRDALCKVHLTIPCLFGQRSDRRFVQAQSFDLKNIAEFINSCNFASVRIYDPHSDVALALINNSYKADTGKYVKESLYNIDRAFNHTGEDYMVLVSPDAGAYKKVFEYGEEFNLPVVAAVKHRDKEGKIDLRFIGDVEGKECLIVDDLLDGGYTFHLLAEKLKEQGATKVYLYITHAYFNKGVEFTSYIDHFFCTNSVKDIEHNKVTQYKVI